MLIIITTDLTTVDIIRLFVILAELLGIAFMVYLLVDTLRDNPVKGISKKSAKTKGGFFKNWLHKNSLTK